MFKNSVNTLHLHSSHMPSEDPDFGDAVGQYHSSGWMVWVDEKANVPVWLKPMMELALKEDLLFINFDSNNKINNNFQTFVW